MTDWRENVLRTLDAERPILLAGPTASGKSALAHAIAARLGGVIVNADALQVFADWRILTARPTPAEEAEVPHALYGHVPGDRPYSVGDWLRDAVPLLRGRRPIFCGGTGLYFAALTGGLAPIPPVPPHVRRTADRRMADEGRAALLAELDAETAARIDRDNPARVQRAWEVLATTGRGLASWHAETPAPALAPEAAQRIVLTADRDWLAARIRARFDRMIEAGVVEEARANRAGWRPDLPSAKAIGARELMAHLDGRLSLDALRDAVSIQTRQYAKRQRSWFRGRMADWTWHRRH